MQEQPPATEPVEPQPVGDTPHVDPPADRWWTQYLGKFENWVSLATLVFVGVYTVLTYCALKTSQEQVVISRDTERRQLRAYLYVDHGGLPPNAPNFVPGGPIGVPISLHSAGSTPAYKLRLNATIEIGEFPMPAGKLSDPVKRSGVTRASYPILFGDKPIEEFVSTNFDQESLDLFKSKPTQQHYRFYVYGSVRYFDIFGIEDPKLERRYDFCFSFEANPLSQIKAGEEDACDKYNKPG